MYSHFRQIASTLLPLLLCGTLLVSAGPAALRTIAQVSLLLTQISLELCQMGIAILRVCGI